MLFIKVLILLVLCSIFIQDIISRSVYWIMFPVLTGLFIGLRLLMHQYWFELWQPALINLLLLGVQLLVVSVWFSIRRGHWVDITSKLIGWGDVLFLITIAFYLSVLNFLFFYIASLVIVLAIWLLIRFFMSQKNKQIPLAGLQSFVFALWLSNNWWISHINLTDDYWLQRLLMK